MKSIIDMIDSHIRFKRCVLLVELGSSGRELFAAMISVKDVADLLSVSEKTVYRWINKGVIPYYKVGESYRFRREELMHWATRNRKKSSHAVLEARDNVELSNPTLLGALKAGGIYYRVESGDGRRSALRSVVELTNLPENVDREYLLEALMAREGMGTTAVGDGVAVPHFRNPVNTGLARPIMSLCFLDGPLDFSAVDGKPVDILFTIFSPGVRSHLHILSHLSFALANTEFRALLRKQPAREKIFSALKSFE